jgi:pyruvate dehydrogenase E1 component alpha subunit
MVRNERLTERATALGIPSARIDGNDPGAVRETVADFAEAAREGGGPAFVELITQRLVGHYLGDAQQYRTRDELDEDKRQEPIARAIRELTESGMSDAEIASLRTAVSDEVEQAAATALADPPADITSVREHLYA